MIESSDYFGDVVNVSRAGTTFIMRSWVCIHVDVMRPASGRAIACDIYALTGATTVQAAVEKKAKGLPLGKTYTEVDECLQHVPCTQITVQAAVEKEAKGLPLRKTYTE